MIDEIARGRTGKGRAANSPGALPPVAELSTDQLVGRPLKAIEQFPADWNAHRVAGAQSCERA